MITYLTPETTVYSLYEDIAAQTNTIVAGWVGSGKSELIHSLIYTIAAEHSPAEVRLWLCDPKMVELERWRSLPHTERYTDSEPGILSLLADLHSVMMQRYAQMKRTGSVKWAGTQIYCVIDELADLMTGPQKTRFSQLLAKIMQLSRAAGIHVIAGTQKASRQVIPAQLQCNFTCQVALKCYAAIESRQVIGITGAELLPGPGVGLVNINGRVTKYALPMTSESDKKALLAWWQADGIGRGSRTGKRGFWRWK